MAKSFSFNPFTGNFDLISEVSIGSPANGLSISAAQVLTIGLSSTSTIGALSNTDWNTFNNKQAAGNYITALTGDATASGPGSAALTLATVNSNVGSFGSASSVSAITVNAKGLVTAAASTSIQIAESQVTNLVSDLAAKQSTTLTNAHILVGNGSNVATDVAVTGDITITNAGVTAIGTNKVANSQLAQMGAHTFKGNNTGSTANALDLTATQLTAELNNMVGDSGSGGTKGLAPAPASGDAAAGKFLKASGAWAVPSATFPSPGSQINSNYAVQSTDNLRTLPIDCTGGGITVTLPAPSAGFVVTVKDALGFSATNFITVARNGTETIDGAAGDDVIMTNYSAVSYISDGTNWYRCYSFAGNGIVAGRAIFAGGYTGTTQTTMDYVQIGTTSSASSFGTLGTALWGMAPMSSTTRGVWGGGQTNAGGWSTAIQYVTIATTGNPTSFGTLSVEHGEGAGISSATRGITVAGESTGATNSVTGVMEYITIASTGNGNSYGTLAVSRYYVTACGSTTRGIISGGRNGLSVSQNTIDYVTIASTDNGTTFGVLTSILRQAGSCSNATRGLIAGGHNATVDTDAIQYITIASTGNSTSFGVLTAVQVGCGGAANATRAIFGGDTAGPTATIGYVTIATTGNATSFGSLSVARGMAGAVSSAHGGL